MLSTLLGAIELVIVHTCGAESTGAIEGGIEGAIEGGKGVSPGHGAPETCPGPEGTEC